jgi:PAS domain S-box-containing protein
LVYINAAFEKTTGYKRSEIIGQNCRFLQYGINKGDVSEPESLRRLSEALRDKQPVRVEITNFRKDGTPFRNLLAMKPIFDTDGNYAFVLGMQFDIGDEDACPLKLKIIDNIFKILPDTVMAEQRSALNSSILLQEDAISADTVIRMRCK